jgi:hypothetical protein
MLDRETMADLFLMLCGIVFFLASFFGTIALSLLSWVALNDEGFHPVAAICVSMMLLIGIWNMRASVRLFNKPHLSSLGWIVGRSVVALCPVLAAVAFLK